MKYNEKQIMEYYGIKVRVTKKKTCVHGADRPSLIVTVRGKNELVFTEDFNGDLSEDCSVINDDSYSLSMDTINYGKVDESGNLHLDKSRKDIQITQDNVTNKNCTKLHKCIKLETPRYGIYEKEGDGISMTFMRTDDSFAISITHKKCRLIFMFKENSTVHTNYEYLTMEEASNMMEASLKEDANNILRATQLAQRKNTDEYNSKMKEYNSIPKLLRFTHTKPELKETPTYSANKKTGTLMVRHIK